MSNYRIYLMSAGHIKAGYNFQCETDAYALTQAQTMIGEHATAEVWAGTRRVGAVGEDMPMAGVPQWEVQDNHSSK